MSLTEAALLREVAVVQRDKTLNEVIAAIENTPTPSDARGTMSAYEVKNAWGRWRRDVLSEIRQLGRER